MRHYYLLFIIFYLSFSVAHAQTRITTRSYTPDPAPVVSGETLYVFTGHDLDTATYFRMPDWQLFSTTDMEHWTDHGVVMSTATFKWARQGDNAWASQAIERNGKWYWYVAAEDTTNHLHGIGVAVADRPEGPWTDPLGKPLIPGGWGYIDPTVFIDSLPPTPSQRGGAQAYLFWGNNGLWYAKLNDDMISIDTTFADHGIRDMRPMLDDEAQFGPRRMKMDYQSHKEVLKTNFEEAPWIYKIGDTYYLEYAAGGVPEHWAYSTAKSIHGPWTYQGRITDEAPGSFTIHGGTIDFRGKSYLFYHDGLPSGGNGFRRSTAIRAFQRRHDGRIPKIDISTEANPSSLIPHPSSFIDPNFHIYLCFGQSNMEGAARWEAVDTQFIAPRFQMLATTNFDSPRRTLGQWYPAECPIVSPAGGLGMSDYFGRTLVAELPDSIKIGVVAVAMGGSPIEMFDKETYVQTLRENPDKHWARRANEYYGGNPYQRLVDMGRKAQQAGVIKGILLHQGCSNNGDPAWPQKVKKIYEDLLADLGLDAKDVPLFVGETLHKEQGGSCHAHNAVIARMPQVIPTAHVISSADCPGNGTDPWHFSATGYRIMGRRYALKALKTLYP